jgi:tetratricopeptide (TPR) repeat protein
VTLALTSGLTRLYSLQIMKPLWLRSLSLLVIAFLVLPTASATCGGGGGGGMGGMAPAGGGGVQEQVYYVPWKAAKPADASSQAGLVVYWFPSSQQELQNSSLRVSRRLSLYAAQCVSMEVVDPSSPFRTKLAGEDTLPVAVLATPDGSVVGKLENKKGRLNVEDVEKLVGAEMKRREEAVDNQLRAAKEVAKSDKDKAVPLYRSVAEQKCMFPKKAKEAAKELKKLGVEVGAIPEAPVFDPKPSAVIESTMRSGLAAEFKGEYLDAIRLYQKAHEMDPADPTPLRYLGEAYRHYTGEWDKARKVFDSILAMQSDPMSRAVALHGLGKMTIHEGDFAKGLSLMERSVETYPLALAYRNLAVYWNSEGDQAKADAYIQQALALDPHDSYNLVFAAAFMAGNGKGDEALKIARENEALLPASYNLAAVYAQTGNRDKALTLLKRHFFQYERFQAVRSEEMMEARVDAVFLSLRQDPDFVSLTSGADGMLDPSRIMAHPPAH